MLKDAPNVLPRQSSALSNKHFFASQNEKPGALGKACHTTLGDGRVIQSSFRKVYQCPQWHESVVGAILKVTQIATAGFKSEGPHWSELDECDALASEPERGQRQ